MSEDWTIEKADDLIARLTAAQRAVLEQLDCVFMAQALVKIRDLQAENAQLRRVAEAAKAYKEAELHYCSYASQYGDHADNETGELWKSSLHKQINLFDALAALNPQNQFDTTPPGRVE